MKRREFGTLLGGAILAPGAWPSGAGAQPARKPVIGILGFGFPEDPAIALNLASFRRGLRQQGFVEGQNVQVEYRWARKQSERLPKLAAELVALPVDVLVNEGGTPSAVEAKKATSTIPIVFHASDAIADGLVENLARPGGNLTGVSQVATETVTKVFQLLTELVPAAKTIALLATGPQAGSAGRVMREIQTNAARQVELRLVAFATDSELEAAYATLEQQKAAAIVFANAIYAERLVQLAARHRVPAVYNQRAYVDVGGLLSYGASIPALYVIKGIYAGRILKGAKPRELPVQQASKFEMVLNLKTAEALGLSVPPSILIAADEVIE